jgi:hypothetical protein
LVTLLPGATIADIFTAIANAVEDPSSLVAIVEYSKVFYLFLGATSDFSKFYPLQDESNHKKLYFVVTRNQKGSGHIEAVDKPSLHAHELMVPSKELLNLRLYSGRGASSLPSPTHFASTSRSAAMEIDGEHTAQKEILPKEPKTSHDVLSMAAKLKHVMNTIPSTPETQPAYDVARTTIGVLTAMTGIGTRTDKRR